MSVTPCLLFAGNAEEAVDYYVSLVPNSHIVETIRHDGKPLLLTFELDGTRYTGAERPGRALHRRGLADDRMRDARPSSTPSGIASPRTAARRSSAAGSRTATA